MAASAAPAHQRGPGELAAAGYALDHAHRFLDIDYEDDDFVFDGTLDGIQIGLLMTFE